MKKIFIAGHNGMVGSAIYKKLNKNNSNNKLITASKDKLNLKNFDKTYNFFKKHKFDEVYLCAAKVGGILANKTYSADFINENLLIQYSCINAAFKTNVKKLLFLGSSCIYPKNSKIPIKEKYLLTGDLEKTNEPYAIAKIAGLKLCQSYNYQYKTDFRSVMPTNLYGPNDNYDELSSHVLAALIKKIYNAKKNKKKNVIIWGTGKPMREFLHVYDVANACIKIMNLSKKKYFKLVGLDHQFINIGYGKDISIKKLANKISKIIKFKGKIFFDKSKPDGTYRKLIDNSKIKKIKWKPKICLEEGIKSSIQDFKNNI